jgi:hypothetical protein
MRSHRQFFAFAVFLGVLTTPISAGAGRLTDFVLRFDFAAADSVERHSIPEAETAALSRALSGRDTAKIFHRERITDESRNFSLIYSRKIAGAPIIIIADAPERDIVLEAPHPVKDRATGLQAVHLLIALGARAAIISGHNRCAARTRSSCSGKTRVCGGGRSAYPSSDPAHNTKTLFHHAHTALSKRWPVAKIVQLHGYAQRDSDTLFILSDGTHERRSPDKGFAGKVRDRIRLSTGGSAVAVSCQDPTDRRFSYRPLCARTNPDRSTANNLDDLAGDT